MFQGQGKFKWADGTEYEGQWKANEMKGMGTKRLKNGMVEIHGPFEGNQVTGKGYKKWKRVVVHQTSTNNLNQSASNAATLTKGLSTSIHRVTEIYIYRG